jgi:hypothetical protein
MIYNIYLVYVIYNLRVLGQLQMWYDEPIFIINFMKQSPDLESIIRSDSHEIFRLLLYPKV